MTGTHNRADILAAINAITGNPASGPIHDWTPAIAEAIDNMINGTPETDNETRIIKAKETRNTANQ